MRLMRVARICYFSPWPLLCLTRGEPVGRGEGEIMVGGEPKRQLGMEGTKNRGSRERSADSKRIHARRKHEYRAHPDLELGSASEGLE